jgi:hypothetical protein
MWFRGDGVLVPSLLIMTLATCSVICLCPRSGAREDAPPVAGSGSSTRARRQAVPRVSPGPSEFLPVSPRWRSIAVGASSGCRPSSAPSHGLESIRTKKNRRC